jgi:RNA polymerase sigma factor (sigma-70 family)
MLMVRKTNHVKLGQGLQHFGRTPGEAVNESRSTGDESGSANEAQRFCVMEHAWLLDTARQVALKRSLQNSGEDLAHDVYEKLKDLSNDVWARTLHKKSYIARVIINKANDSCHKDQPFEPITDDILVSTPVDAMEAAILIAELHAKLSSSEQKLLELIFEQYSGDEIAKRLGIGFATARKRVSRLLKKLNQLSGESLRKPTRRRQE